MTEGRVCNEHQASLKEKRGAARTALALEKALNGRAIAQLTTDKQGVLNTKSLPLSWSEE